MDEEALYKRAAFEKRCPACGAATYLVDMTTFTGNEVREYACTACDWKRIFHCGPALWQILADARTQPPCAVCGRPSAKIQIEPQGDAFRLVYEGPGGSTGPSGMSITRERRNAIEAAFEPPFEFARIRTAGFYDDAGFCERCGRFYCPDHWKISETGGGTCPKGHFKSLDPHWHPEWPDSIPP